MESPSDIGTLAGALATRTDEPIADDYFFLLRVGSNWRDYPFNWEPFRDLAGPLRPSPDSVPVAIISVERLAEISTEQVAEPLPHIEITVTPKIPVQSIAEAWISVLKSQGIETSGSQGWFLTHLGLSAGDVSSEVQSFLHLNDR